MYTSLKPPENKKLRNRSTLVCTNCKRLKTKCDKKLPCMKCITTNKSDSCIYLSLQSSKFADSGKFNVLRQSNDMLLQTREVYKNKKELVSEENKTQGNKYPPLNLTIYTPVASVCNKLQVDRVDTEHLRSLVNRLSRATTDRDTILDQIIETAKEIKNETSIKKNLVLDSKLWNSTVMTSSYTDFAFDHIRPNPLIFPPNLWGDKDFVYLAKDLFEPLLKLYFKKWISVKKIDSIRTDLSYNANKREIDGLIAKLKPYFVDNYNAVLERVIYFKNEVITIAFIDYINSDLVDSIMKEFLDFDKLLYYNEIQDTLFEACFVLSMVDIAETFKSLENNTFFRYSLGSTFEDLNETVIILLSYKRSNEKANFLAFITTIMVTFKTYYFSENSFGGISEELMYPGFREQLGILFKLNFHLPCKNRSISTPSRFQKYKNYRTDQTAICKIWNRFQKVDAMLSIKLKTPLLIDYDYCEVHHVLDENDPVDQLNNDFVLLSRKFAYLLNSKAGTSYRNLINLERDVAMIHRKVGNFKDVLKVDSNNHFLLRKEKSWFDLKLISIKGTFFCCILLSKGLKKTKIVESLPNYHFDSDDYKEILHIRSVAKIKAYVIFIYVMRIIEAVSLPNIIDPALLFCIKKDILTWFGFASLCILDSISNSEEEQMKQDFSTTIDLFTYNLNDLESLLSDENRINDIYQYGRVNFREYKKLSDLLMQIYNVTIKNRIISSSFDFFVKSKVLTLVSYILLIFEEFKRKHKDLSNPNIYNVISNLAREKMNGFQNANDDIKRDTLLSLVVNHDNADTSNRNQNYNNNNDKSLNRHHGNIYHTFHNNSFCKLNDNTFGFPLNSSLSGSLNGTIRNNYNAGNGLKNMFTNIGDIRSGTKQPAKTSQQESLINISSENLDLSRMPPEELVSMLRLFINDDRFTTYITQLETGDPNL